MRELHRCISGKTLFLAWQILLMKLDEFLMKSVRRKAGQPWAKRRSFREPLIRFLGGLIFPWIFGIPLLQCSQNYPLHLIEHCWRFVGAVDLPVKCTRRAKLPRWRQTQ